MRTRPVISQQITRIFYGLLVVLLGTSVALHSQAAAQRPGQQAGCDPKLIDALLGVIENDIVPLTNQAVRQGNKIFGAAMLKKSDYSTVIAATNNETANPLFHGEIVAINSYYQMVNNDESKRVAPKDMIFVATHEPCTLCSSAITWGGYDNFYYFFSHEDSRDSFQIGHDLKILKQVFKHEPGGYARRNDYWTAYSIPDLIANCEGQTQVGFASRATQLRQKYQEMSAVYQAGKTGGKNIPLK